MKPSKQDVIEEWLEDLPVGKFTTLFACERFLRRWPAANVSYLSVSRKLTRAGFKAISGKGPGRTWRRG